MYKRRQGTASIRGHLYEIKLTGLLLFRAQRNETIENFYLYTNKDEIGVFDDVGFRATIKGETRPLSVYFQLKHRETEKKVLTLNSKANLIKYFESFLKVKQRFDPKSKDKFFRGKYEETECIFVLYTTEQSDCNNEYDGCYANILNNLVATGDYATQPVYTDEDVEFLCKIALKDEIRMLVTRLMKFIYQKNKDINDELILRYHVLLAQHAILVSDIKPGGKRVGKFNLVEIFSSRDDNIIIFKEKLCEVVLKKKANEKRETKMDDKTLQNLLLSLFSDPCDHTLREVILQNIITCVNGRLEFIDKMPERTIQLLKNLNIPQSRIDSAVIYTAKYFLKDLEFDLPVEFGNKDMTLKGQNRINHLSEKIIDLLQKSLPNTVVSINENALDVGVLKLNGGLAGAVGNVLVYDEVTKLLKFTDDFSLLEKHGKVFIEKIKAKFSNFNDFRFEVKVKHFPKLCFNCDDQDIVKEFFSKLVLYANQENEEGIGNILKQEIDDYESAITKDIQIKSDAIFFNFYDELLTYWMQPKEAQYLTETSDLYEKARNSVVNDAIISVASMTYMNKIKRIRCTFISSSPLETVDLQSRTIIVTDITTLTFVKLMQSLQVKEHIIFDLKFVVNLAINDFRALVKELKSRNKENVVIMVCDNVQNTSSLNRNLQEIARAVNNIIVITNNIFVDVMKKYFSGAKLLNDRNINLSDLDQESCQNILKKTRVIFQGKETDLKLVADEVSIAFIKGTVLNKILQNETIIIGESIEFTNRPFELLSYDTERLKYEITDLYIDRRISRGTTIQPDCKNKILQTLHDVNDDVVLITAKPGMGKSTLLSYLSIKTKQLDGRLWLLRINLLDYSKQFSKWKKGKTAIDTLEMLKFICQIVVKNKIKDKANKMTIFLSHNNDEVCLKDSTCDDWTTFVLEMFLHYFKNGDVIFLFDAFDEICPIYEDEVISLLNAVRKPSKGNKNNKIWITSRPYNKIKLVLQKEFGISDPYELEPFSDIEQEIYFEKFWKANVSLNELNEAQQKNLRDFLVFLRNRSFDIVPQDNFIRLNKPQNFLLNKVYYHFVVYLQREMETLPMDFVLDNYYRTQIPYVVQTGKFLQNMYSDGVGEKTINEMLEFVGTPLHLYLIAEYFLNRILDSSQEVKQWDLDMNTYALYESFLESLLKKIRFQDKNKMDIDYPDILETYETVRKEFVEIHKKLAAYALFHRNGQEVCSEDDLVEIKLMINKIKAGREKTGLIYSVSNNVPQFIHMTFTEYFAVEYLSDSLKREKSKGKQDEWIQFIINTMFFESPNNVLSIMDQKLKIDNEFASIIERSKDHIFNLLMAQSESLEADMQTQLKSSLHECIAKSLNNFLCVFMSALESHINKNNVEDFIRLVARSGFLRIAAQKRYDDLILKVFHIIRDIDVAKWRKFIADPRNYCDNIIESHHFQRFMRHHIKSFYIQSEVSRSIGLVANIEEA